MITPKPFGLTQPLFQMTLWTIVDNQENTHDPKMLADLPPPIPNCVQILEEIKSQSLVVIGKDGEIRKWLNEPFVKDGNFSVSVSQPDVQDKITAVLRVSGDTPYRAIGGAIYSAQMNRIFAGLAIEPPLCSPAEAKP